jgi:hypothetical protein
MKQEVLEKYSDGTLRKLRENLCEYKLTILPSEVKVYLCTPIQIGGDSINKKVRKVIKMIDIEIIRRFTAKK